MTKSEYQEYLNTPRWRELRKQVLSGRDTCCSKCGIPRWFAAIVYDQDLHVHHKSYANKGTDKEIDDLIPLCRRCHEIETFGRSKLKAPWSAECGCCGEFHFNPYSDLCETCNTVIHIYEGVLSLFFEIPKGNGTLADVLILNLCQHYPLEELMAKITRYKRLIVADNASRGEGIIQ